MGGNDQRADGELPKTFTRYLKLCARMAGLTGTVEFEDALGIASFLVAMGRVPPANLWVDSLVARAQDRVNESFAESLF
jgi:hypothetical protein